MLHFGDQLDDAVHAKVLAADAAVQALDIAGFTETIPSFTSLFVGYDPLVTDLPTVTAALEVLADNELLARRSSRTWDIPVCYDPDFGPDLEGVAENSGMQQKKVIDTHLSGKYKVYMYGFAPGFAYLGGTPEPIRLPRKPNPVRDIPAGSVLIANAQCIVTTLTMPTGWWIIGRSPFPMLQPTAENAFPIDVGDNIRFFRISRREFDAYQAEYSA